MAAGVQLLIGSLDLWLCKILPLILVKELLTYPYAASLQKKLTRVLHGVQCHTFQWHLNNLLIGSNGSLIQIQHL